MDNGYSKWKKKARIQRRKNLKLMFKIELVIIFVSLIVFFFGYETPMFDRSKIIEFSAAFLGLTILNFFLVYVKFKVKKFVPLCNKCEHEIKNIERDCVKTYELIGTFDKTVYETSTSIIKGKTTYDRGVYAMKNDTLERTSTSTFEVKQDLPVVKKFYAYNVHYRCKFCNELFCTLQEERNKPIEIK